MRRSSSLFISRLLAAPCVLLSLFAGLASAQTLRVGEAGSGPGTTVAIPVTFESGANDVAGYQLRFTYDQTLFGTPTVAPGAITACGVNDTSGVVTIIRDTFPPVALADETPCTILFPIESNTAFGSYPLTVTEVFFADVGGELVSGSTVNGAVGVLPGLGTPPQLAYMPPADAAVGGDGIADLMFLPEIIGAQAAAEVVIAAVGGEGAASVSLSCTTPPHLPITGGGTQTLNPGGIPAPIVMQCTPAVAQQRGQLTCTETDTPGGSSRIRRWDLLCAGPLFRHDFE